MPTDKVCKIVHPQLASVHNTSGETADGVPAKCGQGATMTIVGNRDVVIDSIIKYVALAYVVFLEQITTKKSTYRK